jgi:hypothetical protein
MVNMARTSPSTGMYRDGKFTATLTGDTRPISSLIQPFLEDEFAAAVPAALDLDISLIGMSLLIGIWNVKLKADTSKHSKETLLRARDQNSEI